MRNLTIGSLVALLVVVGSLYGLANPSGGGGLTAGRPAAQGTQGGDPTAGSRPELAQYYHQTLSWSACGQQECATMLVPVDYARPDGEKWKIALRRAKAKGNNRIGSLVINPGGPGGSGVDYAKAADMVFTDELRRRYDVVGFDPRGIGLSEPPKCLSASTMDEMFADDPQPHTPAAEQRARAFSKKVVDECVATGARNAKGGPNRVLHMSTTEVAKDMDILRAVLGDAKLNYHGVSYGTVLGSLYADQFPDKVGRLVLDSAVSPNQTPDQQLTYDAQGFASSMDAYIADCVAQPTCPLGRDPKAARTKLLAFLRDAHKTPLAHTSGTPAKVGSGWVGFSVYMSLYSKDYWPILNQGLTQAMTEKKANKLMSLAFAVLDRKDDGGYRDTAYLYAMTPVRCADWPKGLPSKAAAKKYRDADPLFAEFYGESVDACEAWPGPVRQQKAGKLAQGAAPILVIGNSKDPATPIGGTKQLAGDLSSGVLVTAENAGHGAYNSGNDCATSTVDEYLINGTVPQNGKNCP